MRRKTKEKIETFAMTIPAMILISIMIYVPFAMSGYYSLTEWNGIAKVPKFIGLENFRTIFIGSQDFANAMIFTGKYTIVFMILTNVLALTLAVILVQKLKTANLLRGIFFIPYIMSMIIVGFIWKFIFTQGFAKIFEMTHWGFLNWSWLGDWNLSFFSVVMVGVWQSLGFYIVLYIAGLQAVPMEILEAAVVDGASPWKRFYKVTLPLLWPSITTCMFMSLTNSLKVFDIILALTKGGPGQATYSVTLNIYREAFQNNNYGLGSAESLVFFFVVLVLTQIVLKGFRSREVAM